MNIYERYLFDFLGCARYKYFASVLQLSLLWKNFSQLQSESNAREKQNIRGNN